LIKIINFIFSLLNFWSSHWYWYWCWHWHWLPFQILFF